MWSVKKITTLIVPLPDFPELRGRWNFRHCSHKSPIVILGRIQYKKMNEVVQLPGWYLLRECPLPGGEGSQGPAMLYKLFKLGPSNEGSQVCELRMIFRCKHCPWQTHTLYCTFNRPYSDSYTTVGTQDSKHLVGRNSHIILPNKLRHFLSFQITSSKPEGEKLLWKEMVLPFLLYKV